MTSNVQLEKFINNHMNRLKNIRWLGIFSSDKLPQKVPTNSCLIVNYNPSTANRMGHWIAFTNLNSSNKIPACYFDSYGFGPDADDGVLHDRTDFKDFLTNNSSTGYYINNSFQYQGYHSDDPLYSDTCGEWSCLAIITNWGSKPDNPIWNKLRSIKHFEDRDEYVKKYIGIRGERIKHD